MPFSTETLIRLREDATEIIGRYPQARSALLPLLYLVQAEEGYVSEDGIKFCAEVLEITETEVLGVATFYTMYKHEPAAEYQMGVCTNTTCAIMGGDQIYAELAAYIGGEDAAHGNGHHDIKSPDGKVAVERLECNAACDYAPVVMVNWEFFDNMTPQSARDLVDGLRTGADPMPANTVPTRGAPRLCTWKQASKILAGFPDGQAAEGHTAGPPTLAGLRIAREQGWTPGSEPGAAGGKQ
jgi:NADH-quinone oxidoreductase subunit E